jgi:hypothetical protein
MLQEDRKVVQCSAAGGSVLVSATVFFFFFNLLNSFAVLPIRQLGMSVSRVSDRVIQVKCLPLL